MIVCFTIFVVLTKKFINPYKLIFVFGKKGSGKSTLLTKLSYTRCKRWVTFSTEVDHPTIIYDKIFVPNSGYSKGAIYPINPKDIYKMDFPEHSCIFIDEVSLIWDNRDFKSMDKNVIEWFRYQRHHKCRVYFFSQTFDIDKKLRDLADDMFLVNKIFRVFVVAKHMVRKPCVVHPSPDAPARIDDDIVIDSPLLAFFGGRLFAFIPYWAKRYDSFK